MTTYTLNGIANYYDNTLEQDVGGDFSGGITLELVVPDKTDAFSYTVLPLAPGDSAPDDLYVDTKLDDYTVRLNGETINDSNPFDEAIFSASWEGRRGDAQNTIIYIAEVADVRVPGLGLVDASYIFGIGGDAFPVFTTYSAWLNFLDTQLTGLAIPGGSYGPNTDISLDALGATISQNDIITGNGAANTFIGGLGSDKISGLAGNDTLNGGKGNDTLKGGNGADKLLGKTGNDTLKGDAKNDKLFGDAGRDKLFGGSGNDVLNGGGGNDVLVGGGGVDDFVFGNKSGKDTIRDFNAANNFEDINLKAVTEITGFKDLKSNHLSKVGNDVVIDDDNGTVITLQNVALSDLGKADFIF